MSETAGLRAGIVGCGRIGCAFDDDPRRGYVSTHAGAYVRTLGVRLVALADLDPVKLERYGDKFEVAKRYADYRDMLARERLDVLSVCTWNDTHRPIIADAVASGVRAIFCEKPIAESLAAADDIVRLCSAHNVLLMVDHQRRFDRLHQDVAAYLRSGALGALQQATCYYTAGVANTGSHLFDLLRFFLGDAAWVEGRYSTTASSNSDDPNIDGWIGFANGCTVALQACDVSAYLIFEVVLLGTKGRLRVTRSGFDVEFDEAKPSDRFDGTRELYHAAPPVNAEGSREFMLRAVAHLVECLKTGVRPVSSGEDGRAALEIICAMHASAASDGARIALPLAGSTVLIRSR